MPLARISGTVLFFAHIPKTAGTSIEAYMRAKGSLALAGTRRHGWSRTTPQHVHRELYSDLAPPEFYDHGFTVIRDPKARLISEFKMRVEPMRPKLRPAGWLRRARNRIAGRPTYGVRLANRLEYLDFDTWVRRAFAEYRKDPYFKDNHIRPQHEFFDPDHKTFMFEDGIDPVFRWIDEVTGTAPAEGVFFERRSNPLEVTPSSDAESLIRDFYSKDYDLIASLRESQQPA